MASRTKLNSQLVEAPTAVAAVAPGGASEPGRPNASPGAIRRALDAFKAAEMAEDAGRGAMTSEISRTRGVLQGALNDAYNANPAMTAVPQRLVGVFVNACSHWMELRTRGWSRRAEAQELARLAAREIEQGWLG